MNGGKCCAPRVWLVGLGQAVVLGLGIVGCATGVHAAPLQGSLMRRQQSQENDDRSKDINGGIAPQVWIPAVIVVLVLIGVFCLIWTRSSILDRLRGVTSRRTTATTSTTREVTASQLAGGATTGSTTTRTTRPRRTRRTPSQISTTSLPVYMKEPGDQELVIFRGPEEMQDASNAIAEAREAEDQDDDDDDPRDSMIMRDSRMYNPMPASSQNLSVFNASRDASSITVPLDSSRTADNSTAELMPRGPGESIQAVMSRESNNSADSADSQTGLVLQETGIPQEAPPDYESQHNHSDSADSAVIVPPGLSGPSEPPSLSVSTFTAASASSVPASSSTVTPTQATASRTLRTASPDSRTPTPTAERNPWRRSGISFRGFNLFGLGSSSSSAGSSTTRAPAPPLPEAQSPEPARTSNATTASEAHEAPDSDDSRLSGTSPVPPTTPRTAGSRLAHMRHRSSNSGGSSSTLNLNLPFRTLSRQRSSNTLNSGLSHSGSRANLTSPSALSLSSLAISAPLTHTLTRTEIRYPRGGPTAEQIKLISSRESLGKFGVPYGRDAIEHAQNSRYELALDPPPVFESPATEGGPSFAREEEEEVDESRESTDADREESGSRGRSGSSSAAGRSTSPAASSRSRRQDNSSLDAGIPPRLLVPLFM